MTMNTINEPRRPLSHSGANCALVVGDSTRLSLTSPALSLIY